MKLKFNDKYLSIEQFDTVEIPDFMVLTGVNGSGKSHLLEALKNKKVEIIGMENSNIVLFNYENFRLDNEPEFNAYQLSAERESAWQFHEQYIKPVAIGLRTSMGSNYEEIKTICQVQKMNFLNQSSDSIISYKINFKNLFSAEHIKQNPQSPGIYSLSKSLPYSIDEIQHDEFVRFYKPYVYKNDFLPNQLGKVFWDYYVKYRTNQVNSYENAVNGKTYVALSEYDFIKIHGEKPWDLINSVLTSFDSLKYKVNSPEGLDSFGNFKLKLKHIEKENLEVEFNTLSSGEKILMALVASVYKSSSDKHFPDILLLDEVDASLHPSMMKNMLEVIQNIFLNQGVKVILVTHSPTTIALAPDEAIYVVNRLGANRIEKKSKQEALNILTQGFATIEHGLKLFDEIARSNITIITEGNNTVLIKKALDLYGLNEIVVLTGVEGSSGKNQLKTLFDFLSKTNHKNKVIFIFDCDVTYSLESANNTYSFVLNKNLNNLLVNSGIENIFPEVLFDGFTNTNTNSKNEITKRFDNSRKRDFEQFVINRNIKDDFINFSSMISEIQRIKELKSDTGIEIIASSEESISTESLEST